MSGRRIRVFLGIVAVFIATAIAMSFDPHGYRLARQLGREADGIEAGNRELQGRIAVVQKKVDALRSGPAALERAAHENGYVHSDEVLFELK